MPKEEEEYCHRAGRAGRFGRVGTVVSVLTEDELFVLQRCTHTHTHIDVCMHALNHALYSPMSGVNGALVCVRLPAWRGSVRACTCMRGVRSREAACPQHAHKKKHTDKDVCGPEVARTHGLGMRINYKYKSAKQTPLELCLKMAASLTACESLL